MPRDTAPRTEHAAPRAPKHGLRNSDTRWGLIAVTLHWGVALAVFALFALGLWMTSLGYYDPWYKKGPDIHRAVGVLVFLTMVLRLAWRAGDRAPTPIASHKPWERKAAHIAHGLLYFGLFSVMISGYLISTADGRGVSVFGWFDVPPTLTAIPKQEDIAGAMHLWLAVAVIAVALAHGLAALKHHFIDKDDTLKRMLARTSSNS